MYRTTDGGEHLGAAVPRDPEHCAGVSKPRILTITCDQVDGKSAWFGIEEGGLWRSRDRGDTWERIDGTPKTLPDGVTDSDVHCVVVLDGPPKTSSVVVVNAHLRQQDDGETWTRTDTKTTWGIYYTRLVARIPGTSSLLLGIGDGTPGTKTQDLPLRRPRADLAAVDPRRRRQLHGVGLRRRTPPTRTWSSPAPSTAICSARTDGGRSFTKEWREFPEITDVAWTRTSPPPLPRRTERPPTAARHTR